MPLESPRVGAALVRAMESAVMPIDDLAAEESATQLMLAITALPSGDQQLVFDVYFHGRSREDAAAGMGLSAKAVEARLYRIRNRLRALLGGQERDEV